MSRATRAEAERLAAVVPGARTMQDAVAVGVLMARTFRLSEADAFIVVRSAWDRSEAARTSRRKGKRDS